MTDWVGASDRASDRLPSERMVTDGCFGAETGCRHRNMTPAKGETQQAKTGFFTTTKQQHGGEFHLLFALQLAIIIHSGACAGRVREHPDQCALPIHRGGEKPRSCAPRCRAVPDSQEDR